MRGAHGHVRRGYEDLSISEGTGECRGPARCTERIPIDELGHQSGDLVAHREDVGCVCTGDLRRRIGVLPIPEQRVIDEGDAVGPESEPQGCSHVLVCPALVPGRVAEDVAAEHSRGRVRLYPAPQEHSGELVTTDRGTARSSPFGNAERPAFLIDEHRATRREVGAFADQCGEHAYGERGVGEIVAVEEPDDVTGRGAYTGIARESCAVIAIELDDVVV